MRTTLELDDTLHELARRKAFEERRSIGEVISELALRGLAAQSATPRRLGFLAGLAEIPHDFNETPADIEAALDEPLL